MSEPTKAAGSGQRAPVDHDLVREQIVQAASEHFRLYGYGKTTLADLAGAIGFSKAFIYKFFESKQAIGEEICGQSLQLVIDEVRVQTNACKSASDKFRRMFRAVLAKTQHLFITERKLFDIAAHSAEEHWASSQKYIDQLNEALRQIIQEGRDAGEFERKTPLDETCRAILIAMQPFTDPRMLHFNLDLLPDGPTEVTNILLRGLAA